MHYSPKPKREGSVIPLVAVALVGLIALTALAIDIGMMAVARTQIQNAADSAAMAGARTINGDENDNYNFDSVPENAIQAAIVNKIFSDNIQGNPKGAKAVNAHTFESGQVKVEIGSYAYTYNDKDLSAEGFNILFPRTDTAEPFSAVKATIQYEGDFAFGKFLGMNHFNVGAKATAVHRPRDVVIIMDLSGSMRFQSLPGMPYYRERTTSMNPESVFPEFGHYSDTAGAALQGTTPQPTGSGEYYDPSNISVKTNSGPPIIDDFYQNVAGVSPSAANRAFSLSKDSYATTPGGDNYLHTDNNSAGNPYAHTANEIFNGVADKDLEFERKGYEAYVSQFNGYTEGPRYWGKTFFIWPPDPRGSELDANDPKNHANNGAKDWRQRFFFKQEQSSGDLFWLDHNEILFDSTGHVRDPDSYVTVKENGSDVNYRFKINYAAIFHWLRNENPKPFPPVLRAGRIRYYDAIPDPSDTGLNERFWTKTVSQMSNLNERIWREYIDFVLGLRSTGAGTYSNKYGDRYISSMIGNGDRFEWGSLQISEKPDITPYESGNIDNPGGYNIGDTEVQVKNVNQVASVGDYARFGDSEYIYKITGVTDDGVNTTKVKLDVGLVRAFNDNDSIHIFDEIPKYMDYDDNPTRPKHQFWFGPMTLIDFLGNYNLGRYWWPGNCHEAQAWACKVGIQTAIDDIKKNHPSDFIGLTFFSSPQYSSDGSGQHNKAVVPLGRKYQQLKDSLWFPPSTVTGNATEITPYDSDFDQVPRAKGGTAPAMGFMIAYNLLSSSGKLRFYSQPQPLYRGAAGGLGRKGASRLIIFETDGAPNTRAMANLGGSGKDSYYQIRIQNPANLNDSKNVEWPSGGTYNHSELYTVVSQICALDTAGPPGHSTKRKPVEVFCIAYGSLFDPDNSGSTQTNALQVLQNIQYVGNTAETTNPAAFPEVQKIYGSNDQRIQRMQEAFTAIMQSGVQVSLIE